MTPLRFVVIAVLTTGCRENAAPTPSAPGSGSDSGSGPRATPPDAGPAPNSQAANKPIVLPPAITTPPVITKTKLDKATIEKLAGLTYADFSKLVRRQDDKGIQVEFKTRTRPLIAVTIDIDPCLDCLKMDIATWRAKKDTLKLTVTPDIRNRKDTVFEIDEIKVGDTAMIGTYQLGSSIGADPTGDGGPGGRYTDAFYLYYNDGVNQARVWAMYADDPLKDLDAYKRRVPREDLQLIATRFMNAFIHAW